MISISVVALICWLVVGGLGLINCITKRECRWIDYWLVYGVLIVNLIDNIIEELA